MEWINALGEALLTSVQSTATKQLRNSSQPLAELLFLAVLASAPGGVSSGPKLSELSWLFLELSDVSLPLSYSVTLLCLMTMPGIHSK